ncbi:hypothetical protein Psi02_47280 [Planotetraspora silvatica]|uniref:Uncharacterized protein n=1 Tax=Planotetraspora silvatica TaxID=234614 RepID=A0A8J3XPC5_9ACTN|nr:hypothetical protein [Planotetraspora silvatica]GII48304.1 hypothetical protein Psi02_47280 [Planotetraspora silvatica]
MTPHARLHVLVRRWLAPVLAVAAMMVMTPLFAALDSADVTR